MKRSYGDQSMKVLKNSLIRIRETSKSSYSWRLWLKIVAHANSPMDAMSFNQTFPTFGQFWLPSGFCSLCYSHWDNTSISCGFITIQSLRPAFSVIRSWKRDTFRVHVLLLAMPPDEQVIRISGLGPCLIFQSKSDLVSLSCFKFIFLLSHMLTSCSLQPETSGFQTPRSLFH